MEKEKKIITGLILASVLLVVSFAYALTTLTATFHFNILETKSFRAWVTENDVKTEITAGTWDASAITSTGTYVYVFEFQNNGNTAIDVSKTESLLPSGVTASWNSTFPLSLAVGETKAVELTLNIQNAVTGTWTVSFAC